MYSRKDHSTITENPVQLILGQEGKPIDTFLLILSQIGIYLHWDGVLFNLRSVEQLAEKFALSITAFEKFLRKPRWIRETNLQRGFQSTEKSSGSRPTSRGIIFTKEAKIFVEVERISLLESLIRPRMGTTRKITYGRVLISRRLTMSRNMNKRKLGVGGEYQKATQR